MKTKQVPILVLGLAALLILPLAASADEVWNFFGPQSPFPNAPTAPAVAVGPFGGPVTVTNASGFKVTLTPYAIGPTNPTASNGIPGQLTGRNLGPGSDEQGAGVGSGPYLEPDSTTFEVNGAEAIRVDFTDFANIPRAASQHLLFNSLTPGPVGPVEMAHIWQDCVGCTSLGTIVHNPVTFPAPEDFTIPPSAFGHPIFVTADVADVLLFGAVVDTTPAPPPSRGARILLKSCMDETIVTKLPVTGQINALGETENDLEQADIVYVRMDVPRQNTVDIYCHAQSVRIAGIGETFGESPYIAIVDNDALTANPFYFSPKHTQFLYDQSPTGIAQDAPVCFGTFPPVNQYTRTGGAGCEQFRSQTYNGATEVCDATTAARGLKSAKTPAGNAGFYEWFIRVPEKPSGEINIVVECGVLKPNAWAFWQNRSIELCAAETGERIGDGNCVRQEVDAGVSPVIQAALPRITAIVYPGPNNVNFAPFHLTAFKNPGNYTLTFDAVTGAISNSASSQVLDGSGS